MGDVGLAFVLQKLYSIDERKRIGEEISGASVHGFYCSIAHPAHVSFTGKHAIHISVYDLKDWGVHAKQPPKWNARIPENSGHDPEAH